MFARKLSIHLKSDMLAEFNKILEQEIVPVLRQQKGFQDEIAFAVPGTKDVLAFSLWDSKQSAEAYASATYQRVLGMLEKVTDGTPKVEATEVLYSTIHKSRATLSAA